MYFKSMPKLLYSTSLGIKNFKLATNIFAKTKFFDNVLNNTNLYYQYTVKDNEKPEDIAYKIYGDSKRHWIILLANGISDPQYDWVLGQRQLEAYINKKYSSVVLQLDQSESYPANYIVGETVYQGGNSYDEASTSATVYAYNSTNKTLSIKFPTEVFANATIVTGVTSNQKHNTVSVTYNNDGYLWASNTTSHYQVTEVKYNSFDKINTTKKYKVSSKDYNFSTDTVFNRNTSISYSNNYAMSDGTTLTVETSIAPQTYYDYELQLNEEKRNVKLPKPEYVSSIEEQYKILMRT